MVCHADSPPPRRRRALLIGLAATVACLFAAPPPVAAQSGFTSVGDERPVGANRTGEPCRLRLVEARSEPNPYQRFALYCEGWTQPSGEIRRFRAAKGYPAERSLGADPGSVVLGADVSEAQVRATDLSHYRVAAFATHGLLPSELKCKSEPAIALTPPARSTASDDGLLDASEVAQLKLDADWVVLSACNTARPDGNGGAPPKP